MVVPFKGEEMVTEGEMVSGAGVGVGVGVGNGVGDETGEELGVGVGLKVGLGVGVGTKLLAVTVMVEEVPTLPDAELFPVSTRAEAVLLTLAELVWLVVVEVVTFSVEVFVELAPLPVFAGSLPE